MDVQAKKADMMRRRGEKMLGDYTEDVLRKMGVDESRYCEVKAIFGFAPTCWCAERKQWLNRVGKYLGVGNG